MVVQVVAEILDVTDGRICDCLIGEVAREQDESDIADVIGLCQTGEMTKLKGWVSGGIQNLRGALNCREASGVDEFLQGG